ncbi:MAG: 16S rRNA (cytosine(1402)-N(4))-methyltransferase, partial [Rhodobacterales bacterium]|nr:16S rRNA (cytosine(1402)-N(4))-methyltransferase [Rhodobacterales bacterium]
ALADCIAKVVGRGKGRIHPATRTFQGIRIAVNGELDQLESLLAQSVSRLKVDGRLAIITFHSLEDRMVKHFLAEQAGKKLPKDGYGNPIGLVHFELFKAVVPAEDDPNPRARSARLRGARRLPWNER